MSDTERRFHEQWLGMVQPSEGLVVSVPVLVDAQCMEKLPREKHVTFLQHVIEGSRDGDGAEQRVDNLSTVLDAVLELDASRFDGEEVIHKDVSLYVPEGKQLLRPTRALKWPKPPERELGADATPAATAATPYAMLIWEVTPEVAELDKPETITGTWEYPVQAKFERLLRECRVPIGLLSNGWELRLVYAPHGESSGWLAFRVDDMASVSGRPIFDAFVMLLGRQRWFGVAPEHQLPNILKDSRKRNADVTNELSGQVFEALEVLLAGFAAAEERDGNSLLREALESEDQDLYAGLLAVLLRMVFLLYCEDRALLPVEHPLFGDNYSLLGLFDQLQADNGKYPDTMHRRFGAYPQLVSLFRAVFLGVKHEDLDIPARRGELFDPNTYPFLEGWGPVGSAPITQHEDRAAVAVPSVDDHTVFTVLHKLLYLDGQRLSYKALDVEQIGSVYEALMGFDVERLTSGAVRIKLGNKKGAARVWVEAGPLLEVAKAQRQRWLQDEFGFDKATAGKVAKAANSKGEEEALVALEPLSGRRPERAGMGRLVVQPGPERRRTSSHYTPRELTEPIVKRTLDPLIKAIGDEPASDTLLDLVICDPAMGSGAFLVAACRYLADHVVAAWTREGKMEVIADAHEDVVNHARRLVAQRCLYGVDKNRYAVQLARLSLWLATMARNEPFTFVDHALRHGDSLVGLDFEQIKAFHWKPGKQVELSSAVLKEALDEAIDIRKRIPELAAEGTWAAQREKEQLLYDANDALDRVRLIGDLIVGAFFAEAKDKARLKERDRRLALVEQWLAADKDGETAKASELESTLRGLQAELKRTQVPFHWMVEFPEVFYGDRPDPLDGCRTNGAAWVDGFVGNPPFMGVAFITKRVGKGYVAWLQGGYPGTELRQVPTIEKSLPERVYPSRARLGNSPDDRIHKAQWWRFARPRTELRVALGPLSRCLVSANVTKHLVFAWQPVDLVFGNTLNVFAVDTTSTFCVLQSRVHDCWVRLLSSTLEDRAATSRVRYAASDCFETFPFPEADPRTEYRPLEEIGETLYQTRAALMQTHGIGLTKLYNVFEAATAVPPEYQELQRLHVDMDRAVVAAYGWEDIPVPPYCPTTDADKKALQAFEDAVIDRLFELNEKRAAEEEAATPSTNGKKPSRKKAAKRSRKKTASTSSAQNTLPGLEGGDA